MVIKGSAVEIYHYSHATLLIAGVLEMPSLQQAEATDGHTLLASECWKYWKETDRKEKGRKESGWKGSANEAASFPPWTAVTIFRHRSPTPNLIEVEATSWLWLEGDSLESPWSNA